jgi:hypothetical protein
MTFLAPVSLALFGLAAVIAAVYLLRMPRRRIRVPDAAIAKLALADKTRINRQKRTIVSFVLQVAILALLVTAAALPFAGSVGREKRSIVVLLDVSASMRAEDAAKFRVLGDEEKPSAAGMTRFQEAVGAIKGMARAMEPGDRMMLLTVGRTADVAFNYQGDASAIVHLLDGLSPTAEQADFKDACRMAAEMAQSQKGVEIVLVTDGAIPAEDVKSLAGFGPEVVKLVKVGEKSGNLGITNFSVRKNLDSPTDYEAMVTLLNTFEDAKKVEVELLLNGGVFDIAKVNVPARGEAVQVFREKLHVGGILEARLQVVDALADDNVAWEVLRPAERLRVLLVSDDTSANSFLVRAVGSDAGSVEGMVITPEQYRKTIASNPAVLRDQRDAVIFDRWVPEKSSEMPPTHVLAVDCVPPGMPVTAGGEFEKPLIRKWEAGHPLMSYLNLRDVFISSARKVTVQDAPKGQAPVERVAEMVTSPLILAWEREMPAASLAEKGPLANGVHRRAKSQRFVVMAFNPRESDIVLRKELPLLVWNSFLWFGKIGEPASQVDAGGTMSIDAVGTDAGTVNVTMPGGSSEMVAVDAESGIAYFSGTREPGVYKYRIGSKEDSFVVNCGRRSETNVRPAEDLGLKAKVLDAGGLAGGSVGGMSDRRLWIYPLLAATLLLAIEAILFHRRIYF